MKNKRGLEKSKSDRSVLVLLFFILLFSSYFTYSLPSMGRCESAMNRAVQGFRSFQTKRRLKVVEKAHWRKGARILKRMMKNHPDPSVQIEIARAASVVYPDTALDILQELLAQDSPSEELQQAIFHSIIYHTHPMLERPSWDNDRERAFRIFKEWLKSQPHSPEVLNLFIKATTIVGEEEGFDLLKQISEEYPLLNVEKSFAIIASATGGDAGVSMFKERLEKEFSPEEREMYAFYAGQVEGSDSLSVLQLLKEKATSPEEQERLQFAFVAGKTELYGDDVRSRFSSSSSDAGAVVAVF